MLRLPVPVTIAGRCHSGNVVTFDGGLFWLLRGHEKQLAWLVLADPFCLHMHIRCGLLHRRFKGHVCRRVPDEIHPIHKLQPTNARRPLGAVP